MTQTKFTGRHQLMKIKTQNPGQLKKRLRHFGIEEVDYPDKSRFFFKLGGYVFRTEFSLTKSVLEAGFSFRAAFYSVERDAI